MKKLSFYLQLVAVCVIGCLVLSGCESSVGGTDEEEAGLKPSSKPSFNYADYTYGTLGPNNKPFSITFLRVETGETCDLWKVNVLYNTMKVVGELQSVNLVMVLPHQESASELPTLLPGYYQLKLQDYVSGNLTPYTLYSDEIDGYESRLYFITSLNSSGSPVSSPSYINKGDMCVRSFGENNCDFDLHFLCDGREPFAYTVSTNINNISIKVNVY